MNKKTPTNIDRHVGQRILERRILTGMSQAGLAERLDVAHQQIQKYETGASRLSSTRLHDLSNVLDVPIQFFFEGLDKKRKKLAKSVLDHRETFPLVRAYMSIRDRKIRKQFVSLVKSLGNDSSL